MLIVAAALLLPRAARAQNRSGFWGGVGVGVGMADTSCDNCGTRDQQTGGMLAGRAGWAITPAVNYWAGKPGDLQTKRLSLPFATGWKQHVLDFTVNVTFP